MYTRPWPPTRAGEAEKRQAAFAHLCSCRVKLSLLIDSESGLYSFLYKRLYGQTADHRDPPSWWENGGGEYWGCSWLSADSPLGCGSGSPVIAPCWVMKCLLDSSQALMVLLSPWSPCGRNHFLSLPVLGSTHYIMFGFFLILMSFQLVLCLNSFDWITHSQFCFPNWIS